MKIATVFLASVFIATSANAFEVSDRIDQVDKEDMRTKSGEVSGNTMTLRVEDMARTRGRDKIYGKNVDIDVSDLNQSQEVRENRENVEVNKQEIVNNRRTTVENRQDIETISRYSSENRNQIETNSNRIDGLENDIRSLDDNLSAGIASAIAMGQHQYDTNYDGLQMSLGAGVYRSEEAVSMGFGGQINNDLFVNGSVSTNSRDDNAFGVGATWRF